MSELPTRRLIPVPRWPDFHPWPTVPALRWLIFTADRNGFAAVVRRVGKRVLIDEAAFFQWADSQPRTTGGLFIASSGESIAASGAERT